MSWKDESQSPALIYRGLEVTLENLRICQAALEDATVTCLKKLLLGVKCNIAFADLKDDLSNKTPGYSLFTDPDNKAILGEQDKLARHILQSPHLLSKYANKMQQGEPVWDFQAMSEWLKTLTQLNLLCLVQIEMNSGAPARVTELTGMTPANTHHGMLRGMTKFKG